MNQRQKRSFKNSVVIVCEGTETEYQYFTELAADVRKKQPERFGRIKVVPTPEEKAASDERRRAHKRRMRQGTTPLMLYYVKEETSKAEYDKNRSQPARYVREAQLFMLEDGYTEAWVVFDKDVHPGHKRAWELAQSSPSVSIAFSSYSFEEWLLCHFEKNGHAYYRSLCKRRDCGINGAGCKGRDCLIGRLRTKGYIPNFIKSQANLYSGLLSTRLENAFVNAAWLRKVCSAPVIYDKNPYTDVDKLVLHLLDIHARFNWVKIGDVFKFERCNFIVNIDKDEFLIAYDGTKPVIVTPQMFSYCSEDGLPVKNVSVVNLAFTLDQNEKRIRIDKRFRYLRLQEHPGLNTQRVLLFELPFFCP